MRRDRAGAALRVITALLPIAALCQPLPVARRPEDVGFSSERLERVRRVMQADVDSQRIPGAVLLIARQGRIASLTVVGFQDRRAKTPMKADAVFRIASMSKPITSVAAMVLAEEGKLDIGAPVAQYLPEFSGVTVGVEKAAPKRVMTVEDLLRHTSGLTYGFFGDTPVDHMYRNANLYGKKSLAEVVSTLAKLPLLHQPGEVWEYSVSVDVLGRIVEVVSGVDLDAFIAERITRPLRMNDTGFWLNASQAARLARADSPLAVPGPDPTVKPAILWGGGGMYSTAGDYARFSQMLLNGGELDGVRILAPKTVALMTSDQLPPGTERHSPVSMMMARSVPRRRWEPASDSASPSARTRAATRFRDRWVISPGPAFTAMGNRAAPYTTGPRHGPERQTPPGMMPITIADGLSGTSGFRPHSGQRGNAPARSGS